MRRIIGGTLVVLLTGPIPARADEHLVSAATVRARLTAAATEHAENAAVVEALLDTREAKQACDAFGISVGRLKGELPLLPEEELRGLSRRAATLKTDPVAGMSTTGKVVLTVVVLLVILVVAGAYVTRDL
jgi:hypothetical protein